MSSRDFEKVQELIEDAGLAKILRQAKQRDSGSRRGFRSQKS